MSKLKQTDKTKIIMNKTNNKILMTTNNLSLMNLLHINKMFSVQTQHNKQTLFMFLKNLFVQPNNNTKDQ